MMHELHEFEDIELTTSIPAARVFGSLLPPGEGLHAGDVGAIADAYHAPAVYTVEVFRDGRTVGMVEVAPHEIRSLRVVSATVAVAGDGASA